MSTAENEKTILCQMLLDNTIIPSLKLREKHFSDPRCARAYKAIVAAYDKYGGVTSENLTGFSADWISDVVNTIPTSANYEFFQERIIKGHGARFQDELLRRCMTMRQEGKDITDFIESEVTKHSSEFDEFRIKSIGDLLVEGIADIEKRYNLGGKIPGISTGLSSLNASFGGWMPGFYYVIGARPSDGKSAILMNFAVDAAKLGVSVGFISAESGGAELARRIYAREGGIKAGILNMGQLQPKHFDYLNEVGERIGNAKFVVYDEPSASIDIVERKAREMYRRNKIEALFVDYLQYLDGGNGDSRHEKIADISTRLKALSRRLNLPVIVAAQLKNPGQDKKNHRPTKDDAAGSDQILRDADVLMLIHNDRDDIGEINKTEIIIAKSRDGATGIAEVKFIPELLKFVDKEKSNRQDF